MNQTSIKGRGGGEWRGGEGKGGEARRGRG